MHIRSRTSKGVQIMEWFDAKKKIQAQIRSGTKINTASSTYRTIKTVDARIESRRYGYENQTGFVVQIGTNSFIDIPWSVLQECYQMLLDVDGYSGLSFRKTFPIQAKDHPCHVHVIGQIFAKSGLAEEKAGVYFSL
jgi:hypothetical protein